MDNLDHVFSPFAIKNLRMQNRLVMPPMYTAYGGDGHCFTPRLLDHYVSRARGGVGVIIQEATSVRREGLGGSGWLGIWDDSFISGYRQLTRAVHDNGCQMLIQLHHAGRQSTREYNGGLQPVAPSDFTDQAYPDTPHVLTVSETVALEDAFGQAAERAMEAGYDGIELHGAHGYVINQFMSPLLNTRQDEYGGGLDNRLRFALNVIAKVRRVIGPERVLSFRISADECRSGGYTLSEGQLMAPKLVAGGVDIVHVSAGSPPAGPIACAPMATRQGNLLHYAAGIKAHVSAPVIAVGRIVDVRMAEDVLRTGKADLVAMGRALFADPEMPNKARRGELDDIRQCIGCHQGCRVWPVSCLVNAATGRDTEMVITPAPEAKKVVVVGGGPGGLEAARVAAVRGHSVTLFEGEPLLGGRLLVGSLTPHKSEVAGFVNYLERQTRKLGVELRVGQRATVADVRSLRPDAIVVATGGQPVVPERAGITAAIERRSVVVAEDVLAHNAPVGQRVIVMGAGMTGCEVAEYLAEKRHQVAIVTRVANVDLICTDMPAGARGLLMGRLQALGVEILTGTSLEEIGSGEVTVRQAEERRTLLADTVVLAQGYRPNQDLAHQLETLGVPVFVIGDAAQSRTALEAVREGAETGRRI